MFNKRTIIVLWMVVSSFYVFAHSGNIKGIITDSITGQAVNNADIIIQGSPWRTVSDEFGLFS
ncbi:MAG: hypothetical protein L3J56_12370, partial [Bacteroidales bacterium]|nr:hypothetical protein [Bacteroidales bacterium]